MRSRSRSSSGSVSGAARAGAGEASLVGEFAGVGSGEAPCGAGVVARV